MYFAPLTSLGLIALFQHYAWYDIPGIELWKFLNLGILSAGIYFLVKKIFIPALAARREAIREELAKAKKERDAANAKLAEVEARLAHVDIEVAKMKENARIEAEEEKERIRRAAEEEVKKLREQAQREIETAGKAARQELQKFAAEETVRIAEEMIRANIRPEDDTRLIEKEVAELGGSRR